MECRYGLGSMSRYKDLIGDLRIYWVLKFAIMYWR